MTAFKYNGTDTLEVGFPFEVRLAPGQTIEVPDESRAQFEADDRFSSSRTKNPDVTTGAIPVQPPAAGTVESPAPVPAA